MSSPPFFLDYDADGKAVCGAHQLRMCGKCCVDFTFDEEDAETSDGGANSFGPYERSETELPPDQARFVPQWDEQVNGPRNALSASKDYDNPPKPLPISSVALDECAQCHAIWLVGNAESGAESVHPSHHATQHDYAGTSRSLVVQVEGIAGGDVSKEQKLSPRAAVGVFFGKGSPLNVSEELLDHRAPETMMSANRAPAASSSSSAKKTVSKTSSAASAASLDAVPKPPTTRDAQLAATVRALHTVRSQVVPFRRTLFEREAPTRSSPLSTYYDHVHFRLVVATSAHFIVDSVCVQLPKWRFDAQLGAYRNKRGKAVANSALFARLDEEVWALARLGVQVVFWEVPREELVATAGALAELALV